MKKKVVALEPYSDIGHYLEGYEVVSISGGYDGRIYALLVDAVPKRIQGVSVQSATSGAHTYKVLIIDNDFVAETTLCKQRFNYHYVQPIGQDNLLLVGARTRRFSEDNYERNGKIFDADGVTIREFLLGDGIENVQATRNGTIWVGYFDEGVFGNYGWNNPIGAPGLIAWDSEGKRIYANDRVDIFDCYALNAVNDKEIWFYYYTDFLLGRISRGELELYNPYVKGTSAFAVGRPYFLFDKGYGGHNEYLLLKQTASGELKHLSAIKFHDEEDEPIQADNRACRGNMLYLRQGNKLYRIAVEEVAEQISAK